MCDNNDAHSHAYSNAGINECHDEGDEPKKEKVIDEREEDSESKGSRDFSGDSYTGMSRDISILCDHSEHVKRNEIDEKNDSLVNRKNLMPPS